MAHAFPPPAPHRRTLKGVRDGLPPGLELSDADCAIIGGVDPMALRRNDLIVQITELEGCLRYMGRGHPQREATQARYEALRALLARWDKAVLHPRL